MTEFTSGPGAAAVPPRRQRRLLLSDETGTRAMSYGEWGEADAQRVLLCIHAYLSNGHEFDRLARVFAARGWRVVCPDLAGHGASDPLPPSARYSGSTHRRDLMLLIGVIGSEGIDVIGASLGSILGMRLAAEGVPIRRLVLVDGGPFASKEAYRRFQPTIPKTNEFPDLASAVQALMLLWSERDRRPHEELKTLMRTMIRPHGSGFRLRFDRRLLELGAGRVDADADSWHRWVAVTCPTLVVRGEHSIMMTAETAARMVRLRPGTRVMTVANCGHRPSLQAPEQIAAVLGWLEAEDPSGRDPGRQLSSSDPSDFEQGSP